MRPLLHQLAAPVLMALIASGGAASAQGWSDPGAVDEALCGVGWADQDLTGVDGQSFTLDGVSFARATLTNADLSGASMACVDDASLSCDGRCVDLAGATLTNARFLGTDLTGSSWVGTVADGADLRSAVLDGARGRATRDGVASFAGARLAGASLLRVDFFSNDPASYRTDFSGADLRSTRADCRYDSVVIDLGDGETETVVEKSQCPDFRGADFTGADLRSATWSNGRYDEAIFVGADLVGASFKGGDFVGADFSGVSLAEAALRDGRFIDESPSTAGVYVSAVFTGANLADGELSGAVFTHPADPLDLDDDGDVCDEAMGHVDLAGIVATDLGGTKLRGMRAAGLDLAGFYLDDADLTLADLRCADLTGADVAGARLAGIDLSGADLGGAAQGDGVVPMAAQSAVAGCAIPPAPADEAPNPVCPRFDEARAQRISLTSARLDAASFAGADLREADLSYLLSFCESWPVDPDLNDGISNRQFCPDFTGARLSGASFAGGQTQGADFREIEAGAGGGYAALDLSGFGATCATGLVPGENEGDPPVSVDFCPRFQGATLERVRFRDAALIRAEFGCLEPEAGSTVFPDCTDLRGADFTGLTARESTWVAVDLSAHDDGVDVQPARFEAADLSDATITCQGFSYEVIDDMQDPPVVTDVVASIACSEFAGAVLTPGFVAAGALIEGVDWSGQDLTGADLSDATFGCFDYAYTDEAGQPQSLGACSDLSGANLSDADLSGTSFEGVDLSGASFLRSDLSDAAFDAATRFAADYVPNPVDPIDVQRDGCTTSGSPVELRGADLQGANLAAVVDFGGACIRVDKATTYSSATTGLTAAVRAQMTLVPVPEPAPTAASAAALGTLAWLARRRGGAARD